MSDANEAQKLAQSYILRQLWRTKIITLPIVGLMVWYTVATYRFVPYLEVNLISWVGLMIALFWCRKCIAEQFILQKRMATTGKSFDWRIVTFNGWTIIGVITVLMYWIVIMGMLTWSPEFMESFIESHQNVDIQQ